MDDGLNDAAAIVGRLSALQVLVADLLALALKDEAALTAYRERLLAGAARAALPETSEDLALLIRGATEDMLNETTAMALERLRRPPAVKA